MFEGLSNIQIDAALIGGYLLGSIPFGVIVMKAAGAGDPRAIGSHSIGATNVLRSGRRDLAALTLIGDGGKGAVAVLVAWLATRGASDHVQAMLTSLAGGAAFAGHLFPVWLKFKGGKGVATFFGTLLGRHEVAVLAAVMAGLIYLRHLPNIRRLLKGEEPRIGSSKTAPAA
jgi:glycerol-3-phosphate acyltransferase PlsY